MGEGYQKLCDVIYGRPRSLISDLIMGDLTSSQETFRQLQKFVQRKRQFEQRPFKRRQIDDADADDDISELDKLEQELVAAMAE